MRDYEGEILDIVRAYATEHYGPDAARDRADAGADLSAFGLDSMDLVCVAARIEDHYGIAIDPTILLQFRTLREVIAHLSAEDGGLGSATARAAGQAS